MRRDARVAILPAAVQFLPAHLQGEESSCWGVRLTTAGPGTAVKAFGVGVSSARREEATMHQSHDDLLRRRHQLLSDALSGRLTRRQIMQRGAVLGLSAASLGGLLGDARRAAAQTPTPSGHLVSWAPSGQRWELPQKAVYPLFQQKFPDVSIEWVAEPIADYIPRTVVEMSAKSDQYDILHDDYNVVPQLIALGSLEPVDERLAADPDFKDDIMADVPENVMDLYRDKP